MKIRQNIKSYIIKSHTRVMSSRQHYVLSEGISVFLKDKMPDNVQLQTVLQQVEKKIPQHLLYGVDAVYIGQFKDLIDRSVNAIYDNGAIYVTNLQDNNGDLLDDIVHEIAHAVENTYGYEIYADGLLENEFLGKRMKMKHLLEHEGYPVQKYDFFDVDYNKKFDDFLYKEVGYVKLNNITGHLFASAYGATSLRESFANGFEHYYLFNSRHIFQTSPVLFGKLQLLHLLEEN